MRTELFSSKCPDTIIVQETDRDYQRILLYSRTPDLADECIEDFRSQAYCLDMEEFLLIPRSQAGGCGSGVRGTGGAGGVRAGLAGTWCDGALGSVRGSPI
uniref:Apolipoprotein M n=1 Tax=Terrapene triunguis TaxID=2587831 RepID=A0A674JTQ1_9SAUR